MISERLRRCVNRVPSLRLAVVEHIKWAPLYGCPHESVIIDKIFSSALFSNNGAVLCGEKVFIDTVIHVQFLLLFRLPVRCSRSDSCWNRRAEVLKNLSWLDPTSDSIFNRSSMSGCRTFRICLDKRRSQGRMDKRFWNIFQLWQVGEYSALLQEFRRFGAQEYGSGTGTICFHSKTITWHLSNYKR